MDFLHFKMLYARKRDKDFSMRSFILSLYRRVLEGTYYDILPDSYSAGSTAMAGSGSYVQVLEPNKYTFQTKGASDRRPSVRSALCSVVVDESISFLFDDAHFPRIVSQDENLMAFLNNIIEESYLQDAMIKVARDGSVGSGALLIKLIQGRFYYESLLTEYCTPYFDPKSPDFLLGLCEQYKVTGNDLISKGYASENLQPDKIYWFKREFTDVAEIVYEPLLIEDADPVIMSKRGISWETLSYKNFVDGVRNDDPLNQNGARVDKKKRVGFTIDKQRSCVHNLGFVPIVWVKNLPGNIYGVQGDAIDGACTFSKAIDTNTELDYQMSQCGRGLRYSSEPILFVKDPDGTAATGGIDKTKGGILVAGSENADAKMIEINGEGCRAALEYAEKLREIALENIHGNRSSPKKAGFGISGKSMQMFDHPLILLAGKLRISYGQKMLRSVLKTIICMALSDNDVIVEGKILEKNFDGGAPFKLVWSQWFPESAEEIQVKTNTVINAKDGGIISKETAVSTMATSFGINDVIQELKNIDEEQQEFITETSPKVVENIKI